MQSGCVICQDLFDAAVGIVTTKCGHIFHNSCIDQWLARSGTCPECRSKVCKKSLTKLFFNFSFDNKSDNNAGISLDALKKQLHEKDLEIKEKDKTIKKLQTHCARAEKDEEKMHQKMLELQNEYNIIKRDVKILCRIEAKNEKLLQENNVLQSELEHLNNIKTIVEGSSNDTKQILKNMQLHVSSEDGKVATDRIATYCSVIKRELTSSISEKAQLQHELTKLKRKMGILQAKSEKEIRRLEQQVKMSKNLNFTLSERESDVPDSIPALPCTTSNHTAEHRNFDNSTLLHKDRQLTFDFPENKRQKMSIVVMDKQPIYATFAEKRMAETLKVGNMGLGCHARPPNKQNEDSVSRVGYNGLGGHGSFVTGSKKVSFR